ncbi:MAG: protein translocase subunit SecD [Clostridiales bacterium]|nr:protein translocase subunit SecD [Clostridiales bacterium]
MRRNNGIKFFIVIAVIAVLTVISFTGGFFGITIPGSVYDIRQGIDINGGISATLYAVTDDNSKPTQEELDTAKTIIAKRLDKLGILDRQIAPDINNGTIVLEIPWKANETNYDPDAAIQEIGKTALLTFREVDTTQVDTTTGNYLPMEDTAEKTYIILQGDDIVDAQPETNPDGGMQVSLTLSDEGKTKFAEATSRLIGQPIAIFMDDVFISAPTVQSAITDGNCRITLGSASDDTAVAEAKDLADTIRSGSLPFKLDAKQVNAISPLLGKGALDVTVKAAILAFILVCLFMIIRYRLPGILACIALVGHTVLQLLFISWLQITLTLPGLAGIILTIGMGVDANVIIFERIKEELRGGKTLKAAIDVGFKRAFTAVLDANVTTLIAAAMLLIFGTGPLVSFGYTLGIGVLLSFLTAVTVSRILLKSVAEVDIAKHHWLYGV